jgi:predicted CXXCH cytochrome family protein
MLHKPERALCLGCHDDLAAALGKAGAVVHGPVKTSCLACHRGHGASELHLLRDPPPRLCLKCHDASRRDFQARHGGFDARAAVCTGCHQPHVGERKGLLRPQQHPPFEERTCQACHDPVAPPPAPAPPPTVRAGGVALCAECHDFADLPKAKGAHAPVRRGACFDCHAPHAAEAPHLLQAEGKALCARCHDLEAAAFRAGHQKRTGATCTSCHPPHAPRQPRPR